MKIVNKQTKQTWPEKDIHAAISEAQDDPMIKILSLTSRALAEPNTFIVWEESAKFSSGDRSAAIRMIMDTLNALRLDNVVAYMSLPEEPDKIGLFYALFEKEGETGKFVMGKNEEH